MNLKQYVRYVDDIVIVSENKDKLVNALPIIEEKLKETHQTISKKKTRIDTAYHGVPFLGRISYPYGYQKPNKQVIIRVYDKAKKIQYIDEENLIAKTNSQIGTLKKYNCKKLILNYSEILPEDVKKILKFDSKEYKFTIKKLREDNNMLAVLEMIEEENKRLIAKGEKKGIRLTAKKMLEEGIPLDKVLKITGLNKEDIQ